MWMIILEGVWTEGRSTLDFYKEVWMLPCSGDRQNFNLDQEVMASRWGQTGNEGRATAPRLLSLHVTTCPNRMEICNKPIFKQFDRIEVGLVFQ